MKKIVNVLLGTLLFAALFMSCQDVKYELTKVDLAKPEVTGASVYGANIIKWKDVEHARYYRIYRKAADGEETLIAQGLTPSSNTEYEVYADIMNDSNILLAGKTYTYRLVASRNNNRAGSGNVVQYYDSDESYVDSSATVSVTVKKEMVPPYVECKLPAPAAASFTKTVLDSGEVIITPKFGADANVDGIAVKTMIGYRTGNQSSYWSRSFTGDLLISASGKFKIYAYNTYSYGRDAWGWNSSTNSYGTQWKKWYADSDPVLLGEIEVENKFGNYEGNWSASINLTPHFDTSNKLKDADVALFVDGQTADKGLTFSIVRQEFDSFGFANGDPVTVANPKIIEGVDDEVSSRYYISVTDKNVPKLDSAKGNYYKYYAVATKGSKEYKYALGEIDNDEWNELYNADVSARVNISNVSVTDKTFESKATLIVTKDPDSKFAATSLVCSYGLLKMTDTGRTESRLTYVGYNNGSYNNNGSYVGYMSGSYDYVQGPVTIAEIVSKGTIALKEGEAVDFKLENLLPETDYRIIYQLYADRTLYESGSRNFTTEATPAATE